MELLDVVDDHDKVVGRETRKYVHDNYLIHRGVHVFVVDKKGRILIQKRSKFKKDRAGYLDASVGGQVLASESYKEAAVRETKEELGLKIRDMDNLGKYKSFSERQREIRTLFSICSNGPFSINKKEIEWVKFYSIAEIKKMIKNKDYNFTDGFKLSFDMFTQKAT